MATVFNQVVENEEENNQNSQDNNPQPMAKGTSASAGVSTQQAQPQQKQSSAAPSKSGQFTNIQSYLQANKQGAQQLGQNVAQKTGQKAAAGLQTLSQAKQESLQGVQQQAQQGQQAQQQAQQAVQNIRQGQQQADYGQLEQQARQGLSDQYKKSVEESQFKNLQNLTNKQQEFKDLAQQTRTSTGQQAILEREFKRPTYTQGQSRLDTLLLGSSKEGQQGLSKARQELSQYNPELQRSIGQFEQERTNKAEQLNQGMQQLQQRIADATNQGVDASADISLYAQLKQQADQLNAQRAAETKQITTDDALNALQSAGYKVRSLNDLVTIPGTNVRIKAGDLARNPNFFKESFKEADVSNVNQEALNRLNILNRLGNVAEIQGSTLDPSIQRGLSEAGSRALAATKSALASQGLTNLDALDLTGSKVNNNIINQIAQQGIGAAGIRGEAVQMLSNLQKLPDAQLAQVLSNAGYGANPKNAKQILQGLVSTAQTQVLARREQNTGQLLAKVPDKDKSAVQNALNRKRKNPSDIAILKKYGFNTAEANAGDFSSINEATKKIAQQAAKYNQQQAAIQSILNKYIKGGKK